MKTLDLFSGIGGFSLGLESVGFETVGFCEIDPFCQKVLKKHWPDIPIHKDIKELNGHEYRGSVRLVCGGFPCQPYSVAGKRRGEEDDRALWKEMFRVIREVEPDWVIGENVPGIVSMELDKVLSDLGDTFDVQTFDIPAVAIDARHTRHRIWVIGRAKYLADPYGNGLQGSKIQRGDGKNRAKPIHQQFKRFGGSSFKLSNPRRKVKWKPEPRLDRMAHGIPNRLDRIKGLGNAVCPPLVSEIGRLIMQHDLEYST